MGRLGRWGWVAGATAAAMIGLVVVVEATGSAHTAQVVAAGAPATTAATTTATTAGSVTTDAPETTSTTSATAVSGAPSASLVPGSPASAPATTPAAVPAAATTPTPVPATCNPGTLAFSASADRTTYQVGDVATLRITARNTGTSRCTLPLRTASGPTPTIILEWPDNGPFGYGGAPDPQAPSVVLDPGGTFTAVVSDCRVGNPSSPAGDYTARAQWQFPGAESAVPAGQVSLRATAPPAPQPTTTSATPSATPSTTTTSTTTSTTAGVTTTTVPAKPTSTTPTTTVASSNLG